MRAQELLEQNKMFAPRRTIEPSIVQGLVSCRKPGAAPKLSGAQMMELDGLVMAGPDPKIHKVVRWRCVDL